MASDNERSDEELSETFERFAKDHTRELIEKTATRLRAMADEVDRLAAGVDKDAVYAAANVVHTVHWGVANLNLDVLINSAGRVRDAIDEKNKHRIEELLKKIEEQA